MKYIILILMLAGLPDSSIYAGNPYSASSLPAAMIANANVVKRKEVKEVTVMNTRYFKLRHMYAITVLNENGKDHAELTLYYDKFSQIKSVKGTLYNRLGLPIKKLKNKDISDLSAVDNSNLAEDSRVKKHQFHSLEYPYTVEYEIESEHLQTFNLPAWVPQEGEHYSVEASTLIVSFPQNAPIRHKAFNFSGQEGETISKGMMTRTWETNPIPAIRIPFALSSWADLATTIYLAPTQFEIGGFKGNLGTWEGFGLFQQSLNQGRGILPPAIEKEVQNLTTGLSDPKEKIRILYEYLQKNTRYISIQLGLGGWQPFDAASVAGNGYGDCKALTNYMQSLLASAGIKSYYTVVYAGNSGFARQRLKEDFPANQFNHVVLCIPGQTDTTWLECTSPFTPAGYMGSFTGNRKAVMILPEGAKVVATPRYGMEDNIQQRRITAKLDESASLVMQVKTSYSCLQQDGISHLIQSLSQQKIAEYLHKSLPLSTYEVTGFSYVSDKQEKPTVTESLAVSVSGFATKSGKRLFIVPNILNRSGVAHIFDSTRKTDFYFDYAYQDSDTVDITIPEGYIVESGLQDTLITSGMGTYQVQIKMQENKIMYIRKRTQLAGTFPLSMQAEIIRFYRDIYNMDSSRVVLIKKG